MGVVVLAEIRIGIRIEFKSRLSRVVCCAGPIELAALGEARVEFAAQAAPPRGLSRAVCCFWGTEAGLPPAFAVDCLA